MEDLIQACESLRSQAKGGQIAYGINLRHKWSTTAKQKTFDLAVGRPLIELSSRSGEITKVTGLSDVFIACEAKSVMTEHSKSQPRVFDELSSSHEIVHKGSPNAIAAGITVVNIANTFVSPLRQRKGNPLYFSPHRQPRAAERMVNHLRGLPIRESVGQVGFDAYSTIVLDCNNQAGCDLWEVNPAPQPGDKDHYVVFIERIARFYEERFA